MKRAVLLDVSAIMYRAYFSLMNMRTSNQEPSGAVYGFLNTFNGVLEEFSPDYIAACFDVNRESLQRREIYDAYKANRDAMPEDMQKQLQGIKDALDIYNVNKVIIEGHEADDALGTLARKFAAEGIEVYIVTGDKDLSQIISKNIKIALLSKGKEKFKIIETAEDVQEQLGVLPEEIPDLFGLQGDNSDGIPGVKGVGPKTAVKLISEYKNLEKLYENIEDIKGKLKDKLLTDREKAFISRKLAIINTDLEYDFEKKNFAVSEAKLDKLIEFLQKYEFKSLMKKLGIDSEEIKLNDKLETELENIEYLLAKEYKDIERMLQAKEIAMYYIESGIALADDTSSLYIPLNHNYIGANNFESKTVIKMINESCEKITTYNIKNILKTGVKFEKFHFDVMLGAHILQSDSKFDLEKTIFEYFSVDLPNYKSEFKKETPERVEIKKIAKFSGLRAYYIKKLTPLLEKNLNKENLEKVYYDFEFDLINVLHKMEKFGIKIDVNYFKKYSIELREKIAQVQEKIYSISEEEFNLNSPKQLSEVLFEKMGISPVKKTKTGYSTNVDVLETLESRGFDIASYILKYRSYTKLQTTYVDVLPNLADKDGRIHTTYHQEGTSTGRLSSSDPNLQNIPVKTEEGIKIRKGFVPEKGYSFISVDYSQIELRVLAELSKDKQLIEAYKNNMDLHTLTARKIFDKSETDEISREERVIAKIVNFSIIYGKTPFGLSKEINISVAAAKDYIEKYFEQYKGVRDFIDDVVKSAEKKGFVSTYFGRKRTINGIKSRNKNLKSQAERMAVNTVVQGTAADILKLIMIELDKALHDKPDIRMLLQVHDELIFEVKDEKISEYSQLIQEKMENTISFADVTLKSNLNYGKNWSEVK